MTEKLTVIVYSSCMNKIYTYAMEHIYALSYT